MEGDEEVLEYYRLSQTYLIAALDFQEKKLYEPALFNGIHAFELGVKAALLTKADNHNSRRIRYFRILCPLNKAGTMLWCDVRCVVC